MYSPLFSTYTQGENRVTSTIMAVFERLPFILVEQILSSMADSSDVKLLTFKNQPTVRGANSIPDAKISSSFSYWIETKTVKNALTIEQIKSHLETIAEENRITPTSKNFLLVLTPDDQKPIILDEIDEKIVSWGSFDDLVLLIKEELIGEVGRNNGNWFIREQDRALLLELVNFLAHEKLLDTSKQKVQVIAAKTAWPDFNRLDGFYEGYSAYICQPNRRFQAAEYLAFYENGRVHKIIPKILYSIDEILLNEEGIKVKANELDFGRNFPKESDGESSSSVEQRLIEVLTALSEKIAGFTNDVRPWWIDESLKLVLVSSKNSEKTENLNEEIINNKKSTSGRTIPLTYGQARYFDLALMKRIDNTSALESES